MFSYYYLPLFNEGSRLPFLRLWQSKFCLSRAGNKRLSLLLPLTSLLLVLVLSACGDTDYTTVSQNNNPAAGSTPPFPQATPTDWGIANFLRDFLISFFTGAARFVGDIAIGILTWLLQSAQAVRFNFSDNRVCAAVPNGGITLEPLARCSVQLYDILKYAPLVLWFIPVFYLLWKSVFAGLFPALEVSWGSFAGKLVGVTIFGIFFLDGAVTIVVDLPMRLFFWILNADAPSFTLAQIDQTSASIGETATALGGLANIFTISPALHRNDLMYVIILSVIAVLTALPVVAIGLFFLVRAVVLILWFAFSPLALCALLLPETSGFYFQWQNRLISMSVSVLPAAVIFKLAIVIKNSVDAGRFNSDTFQFLLVMLAMLILFGAGGFVCFQLFMNEARGVQRAFRSGTATLGALGVAGLAGRAGSGLAREGLGAARSGWKSLTEERFHLNEGEGEDEISTIRNPLTSLKNRTIGVRGEEVRELTERDVNRRQNTRFTNNQLPISGADVVGQTQKSLQGMVNSIQSLTFTFERMSRGGFAGAAVGAGGGAGFGGSSSGNYFQPSQQQQQLPSPNYYPAGSPVAAFQRDHISRYYGPEVGDALGEIDALASAQNGGTDDNNGGFVTPGNVYNYYDGEQKQKQRRRNSSSDGSNNNGGGNRRGRKPGRSLHSRPNPNLSNHGNNGSQRRAGQVAPATITPANRPHRYTTTISTNTPTTNNVEAEGPITPIFISSRAAAADTAGGGGTIANLTNLHTVRLNPKSSPLASEQNMASTPAQEGEVSDGSAAAPQMIVANPSTTPPSTVNNRVVSDDTTGSSNGDEEWLVVDVADEAALEIGVGVSNGESNSPDQHHNGLSNANGNPDGQEFNQVVMPSSPPPINFYNKGSRRTSGNGGGGGGGGSPLATSATPSTTSNNNNASQLPSPRQPRATGGRAARAGTTAAARTGSSSPRSGQSYISELAWNGNRAVPVRSYAAAPNPVQGYAPVTNQAGANGVIALVYDPISEQWLLPTSSFLDTHSSNYIEPATADYEDSFDEVEEEVEEEEVVVVPLPMPVPPEPSEVVEQLLPDEPVVLGKD